MSVYVGNCQINALTARFVQQAQNYMKLDLPPQEPYASAHQFSCSFHPYLSRLILQSPIESFFTWYNNNHLRLNISKTKEIVVELVVRPCTQVDACTKFEEIYNLKI